MAQTLDPISDVTLTNWVLTGGATATAVLSDASDATYATWGIGGNEIETLMTSVSTPGAGTGTLTFRGQSGGASLNWVLREGATSRASGNIATFGLGFTAESATISAPEIASITDWSDVRVEFQGTGVGGIDISKAQLTIPDAATTTPSRLPLLGVG